MTAIYRPSLASVTQDSCMLNALKNTRRKQLLNLRFFSLQCHPSNRFQYPLDDVSCTSLVKKVDLSFGLHDLYNRELTTLSRAVISSFFDISQTGSLAEEGIQTLLLNYCL